MVQRGCDPGGGGTEVGGRGAPRRRGPRHIRGEHQLRAVLLGDRGRLGRRVVSQDHAQVVRPAVTQRRGGRSGGHFGLGGLGVIGPGELQWDPRARQGHVGGG